MSQSVPQNQEPKLLSPSGVHTAAVGGSLDRLGAGDHDQPYRSGWRPRSGVPYPFNTRQYNRLLILPSRVQNGLVGANDIAA